MFMIGIFRNIVLRLPGLTVFLFLSMLPDAASWSFARPKEKHGVNAIGDSDGTAATGPRKGRKKLSDERIEELISSLQSDNPRTRSMAAAALVKAGDVRAIRSIINVLRKGPGYKERAIMRKVLIDSGEAAVMPLIEALSDEDGDVRSTAADVLGSIGGTSAVAPLIASLNDSSYSVRAYSARSLGAIGDAAATVPITALLVKKEEELTVRSDAMEALVAIGDGRAVEPIIAVLIDRSGEVLIRRQAAGALGSLGDRRAIEPLLTVLLDLDEDVVSYAVSALEKIGWKPETDDQKVIYYHACGKKSAIKKMGKAATESLIALLSEDRPETRLDAVNILGQINDKKTVKPLVDCLVDEDQSVRAAAAKSLDKLKWKPATPLEKVDYLSASGEWDRCVEMGSVSIKRLVSLLDDEEFEVRWEAAKALERLDWNPPLESAERVRYLIFKEDYEQLVNIGGAAVEPLLKAFERYSSPEVAEALGRIGDPRAVGPLVAALDGLFSDVRIKAAGALGRIGDSRAVDPLINLLKRDEPEVRIEVLRALGRIGDLSATAPLVVTLGDGDHRVREAAAGALDRLEWRPANDGEAASYCIARKRWTDCSNIGSEAVAALVEMLGDGDGETRSGAVEALGALVDSNSISPIIRALSDEDFEVREKAAEVLGNLGYEKAAGPLVNALRDDAERVRVSAAEALDRLGWESQTEDQRLLYILAIGAGSDIAEGGDTRIKVHLFPLGAGTDPSAAGKKDYDPGDTSGGARIARGHVMFEIEPEVEVDIIFSGERYVESGDGRCNLLAGDYELRVEDDSYRFYAKPEVFEIKEGKGKKVKLSLIDLFPTLLVKEIDKLLEKFKKSLGDNVKYYELKELKRLSRTLYVADVEIVSYYETNIKIGEEIRKDYAPWHLTPRIIKVPVYQTIRSPGITRLFISLEGFDPGKREWRINSESDRLDSGSGR